MRWWIVLLVAGVCTGQLFDRCSHGAGALAARKPDWAAPNCSFTAPGKMHMRHVNRMVNNILFLGDSTSLALYTLMMTKSSRTVPRRLAEQRVGKFQYHGGHVVSDGIQILRRLKEEGALTSEDVVVIQYGLHDVKWVYNSSQYYLQTGIRPSGPLPFLEPLCRYLQDMSELASLVAEWTRPYDPTSGRSVGCFAADSPLFVWRTMYATECDPSRFGKRLRQKLCHPLAQLTEAYNFIARSVMLPVGVALLDVEQAVHSWRGHCTVDGTHCKPQCCDALLNAVYNSIRTAWEWRTPRRCPAPTPPSGLGPYLPVRGPAFTQPHWRYDYVDKADRGAWEARYRHGPGPETLPSPEAEGPEGPPPVAQLEQPPANRSRPHPALAGKPQPGPAESVPVLLSTFFTGLVLGVGIGLHVKGRGSRTG